MEHIKSYKELFNGNLQLSIKTGAQIVHKFPKSKRALLKVIKRLNVSDKLREESFKKGLEVPPLIIISATNECNLKCAGCYSHQQKRDGAELSDKRKAALLNEASFLGVSIVMLAGGEPLLSKGWIQELSAHPEFLGVVFTNGTLLNKDKVEFFDKNRHIIPAFSIEGNNVQTDLRRGNGVYEIVEKRMAELKAAGIPFGVSMTATSQNIHSLCDEIFIEDLILKGCVLFFYVEYVPVAKGTEPLILSMEAKKKLHDFCRKSAKVNPALFIPFPGSEDLYGGCLAAGRGFIHIGAGGELEPCPFAPFSDANLSDMSLKDALSSKLLQKIRENHHLLKEGQGGCALFNNQNFFK